MEQAKNLFYHLETFEFKSAVVSAGLRISLEDTHHLLGLT